MNFVAHLALQKAKGAKTYARSKVKSALALDAAQQRIKTLSGLSDQQKVIVDANLDGLTLINAYAGTGKTSTLAALSHRHCERRILYLAYNKSAQVEAQSRFGSNTRCSTIHALAFGAIGKRYRHKLGQARVHHVMEALNLNGQWGAARLAMETVNAWCCSDATEFPRLAASVGGPLKLDPKASEKIAGLARKLWDMMCDESSPMPMPHDGYLKLYQLSRPALDYDIVMLDEAQDTNPVTWAIVSAQTCPIVIVGDRYQSIYEFRGAVNAMTAVSAQQEFSLTQSWRFGPCVAEVASLLLKEFYGETTQLEGMADTSRFVDTPSKGVPQCYIARTNAEVFHQAVEALERKESLGFVGGIENYQFGRIEDVRNLHCGRHDAVRDSFIRGFASFAEFRDYAESAKELELLRVIKISEMYGDSIFSLLPRIYAESRPLENADAVFSTAHRSKGLTVDNVVLTEDYRELPDEELDPLDEECGSVLQEVNLLYVAMTRARRDLKLNSVIDDFLSMTRWEKVPNTKALGGELI